MTCHGPSCSQISHYRPAQRMRVKEFHSQVIHTVCLGRNNPRHQYILVAAHLERFFVEQDLWILGDNMLNMMQWRGLAVMKGASILGCIKGALPAGEGR